MDSYTIVQFFYRDYEFDEVVKLYGTMRVFVFIGNGAKVHGQEQICVGKQCEDNGDKRLLLIVVFKRYRW